MKAFISGPRGPISGMEKPFNEEQSWRQKATIWSKPNEILKDSELQILCWKGTDGGIEGRLKYQPAIFLLR